MYLPDYTAVTDLRFLRTFIQENSFGTLVSDEGKSANHYPFLISEEEGQTVLWTHLARSNSQWKSITTGDCLAMFTGPHAYMSPIYYTEELNVPTWNYTAVHARCTAEVVSDLNLAKDLMKKLVTESEEKNNTHWNYDLPDAFHEGLMEGIVWLKLQVLSLEGKFKLSQNRELSDYQKIITTLSKRGSDQDKAILHYMNLTNPFRN